jgi:hypothetical protein
MKLISDIDAAQIKRIFDVLREGRFNIDDKWLIETLLFAGMSQEDVT